MRRYFYYVGLLAGSVLCFAGTAFAEGAGGAKGDLSYAIALVMGIAALAGTFSQSKAIASGLDAIGRNPSAAGKLFTPMLIGLAFIESLVILAFVIAFSLLGQF